MPVEVKNICCIGQIVQVWKKGISQVRAVVSTVQSMRTKDWADKAQYLSDNRLSGSDKFQIFQIGKYAQINFIRGHSWSYGRLTFRHCFYHFMKLCVFGRGNDIPGTIEIIEFGVVILPSGLDGVK